MNKVFDVANLSIKNYKPITIYNCIYQHVKIPDTNGNSGIM